MNTQISHPWTAFIVIIVLSAVLSNYGVVEGSLLLLDLFAGIAIYKWVTSQM